MHPRNGARRRSIIAGGAASCLAASIRAAHAQAARYPGRPIRLIVPYPPGGLTDVTSRLIGKGIADRLGQPVVIDNKPGGNSIIGAGAAASSPADGYTLVMVIAAHSANATLYAGRLPFDALGGFAPVSHVVSTPLLLGSGPQLPARDLQGLIALAREKPDTIVFGSSGVGSGAHLAMEDLMQRTGIRMIHSPYRGTQPALQDVLAGRIGCMFDVYTGFAPHMEAGTLRALGVASREREPSMPGVPTIAEAGVPDFVAHSWCLLMAPAGTPAPIVDELSKTAAEYLRQPDTRARLDTLGLTPVGNTPEEATAFLRGEIERWGKVIRTANVQAE